MARVSQKRRAQIMRRMQTKEEKSYGTPLHHGRLWRLRKFQVRISVLRRESLQKAGAAARRARKQAQLDAAARAV